MLFSIAAFAQVENPTSWSIKPSKSIAKKGEIIEISFKAIIENGWYMYSVGKFEMAPALTINFNKNNTFELIGSPKTIHDKKKVDEYIGEYRYFVGKAEVIQKVKILSENPSISGTYEYSNCSLESGICLPPKEENFSINEIKVSGVVATNTSTSKTEIEAPKIQTQPSLNDSTQESKTEIPVIDTSSQISLSNTSNTPIKENESYWEFFILAFLSGLAALLTPCVFPMIPMTVTFFLNSGKNRAEGIFKAFIYGFSIILIYTIIGTLFAKLAGPEAANFLSTHWLPNLFFFVVFIIFASSFLGMFEITLPSWIINASDKQSDRGGYIGIFFMSVTLVLVSFSCTGPIVGTILVQSAGGQILKPIIGMFGFSLAFAIPFTLFAIFPTWLNKLPKSGGWLNSVKVVLGFLELAFAFKFLSLADQAYHWNLLDREINIAIWIVIFMLLGLYLIHKIKTPHDDTDYKEQAVSVPKLALAITSFTFVIYLFPGMFGAPLKALSGYLPPQKTHDFDLVKLISQSPTKAESVSSLCESPKYGDFLELPHGIQGYFDYKQALKCAKIQKKPVFIDFTGHGCVNCREMEANVWSNEAVIKKLKNDFVVVALYVDDKTELPESEWYTSTYDGRVKKTIGKQNADFQITTYQNNAQPYYIIVDENGKTLAGPISYTTDVRAFLEFLKVK